MANAYETGNQPRLSSKRHAATPQQQHVHAAAQRGGSARTSSFNLHFISQYRTQKSYDFLHLRVINFNDHPPTLLLKKDHMVMWVEH